MLKSFSFLFFYLATSYSIEYSCMDESGKAVDWFYMYKLPDVNDAKSKLIQEGEAYAYITSKKANGWTLSKKSLDDKDSIPGWTLEPIYEKAKKDILYLLYNDQVPGKNSHSGGGHAKGVVVAGNDGGFWLVHSVPRFPLVPTGKKKYSFSDNGLRNGQSFLCITLKPDDLEIAGSQIMINEVHVYADSVPKDLAGKYPNLADVADGVKDKKTLNKARDIYSAGGTKFRVFAKSGKYNKELYTDFVAPDLKVNLILQTWPNGRNHQKSSCSRKGYNVENVDETTIAGVSFTSSKDHSKWCMSSSKSKPWVCVGDINKDDSQEKRGGGTVCIKDKAVWETYDKSVTEIEGCFGNKKSGGKGQIGLSPLDQYVPYWKPQFWRDVARFPRYQGLSRFFDVVGPI